MIGIFCLAFHTAFAQQTQLRFATSLSSSTGHVYGAGIASLVNKYSSKVQISAFATAGVVENDRLLRNNNAQIAMHGSGQVINSYNGLGNYKGKPFSNLRLLWNAYPVHLNFIVPANSSIRSIDQFKRKKFGTGNAGSTTFVQVEDVLKAYGFSYKDLTVRPLSLNEQVAALKDGNIDGFGTLMGANTPALVDLALSKPVRWLSIPDDIWNKIKTQFPKGFYSRSVIPAGTYPGQNEDVKTIASMNMWVTTSDVPDDVVYEILKIFWDHKAEADSIHPIIKETPTIIVEADSPIPLHPGARRYLAEKGMLK